MAEQNGTAKWVMWILGIIITIGLAAQAAQLTYTNMKFTDHEKRPHVGSIVRTEFEKLYNEIEALKKEVKILNNTSIEMKIILQRMEQDGR